MRCQIALILTLAVGGCADSMLPLLETAAIPAAVPAASPTPTPAATIAPKPTAAMSREQALQTYGRPQAFIQEANNVDCFVFANVTSTTPLQTDGARVVAVRNNLVIHDQVIVTTASPNLPNILPGVPTSQSICKDVARQAMVPVQNKG